MGLVTLCYLLHTRRHPPHSGRATPVPKPLRVVQLPQEVSARAGGPQERPQRRGRSHLGGKNVAVRRCRAGTVERTRGGDDPSAEVGRCAGGEPERTRPRLPRDPPLRGVPARVDLVPRSRTPIELGMRLASRPRFSSDRSAPDRSTSQSSSMTRTAPPSATPSPSARIARALAFAIPDSTLLAWKPERTQR